MSSRVDKDEQILQSFEVSKTAEKSIDYHVHNIAKAHLEIGTSKEQYIKSHKADFLKENGLAADKRLSISEKSQISQLHSWGEYHKFCSCVKNFFTYCRAEFNIKNFDKVTPDMAKSFCSVLADKGYSKNTVNGYMSQIEKLGAFTGQGRDFHEAMKEFRGSDAGKTLEDKATTTRAYADPQKIVDALKQVNASFDTIEKASFSASLELRYGLRTNDACHFSIKDDKIFYNSKNGMKTAKILAPEDIAKARSLAPGGRYDFSVNTLKDVWGKACRIAGEENHGQHGLRHNFAQNLYTELRDKGISDAQAKAVVSKELNHERPQITQTYLR